MTLIVMVIVFVLLLLIGMPIAFVVGLSGLAWFFQNPDFPLTIAVQRAVAPTQSFAFLAVPFFIFAGNLMNHTGITKYLIIFARLLTRRMSGGMAQVSVLLSLMMGGISGSAVADAAMQARILGPEMTKRGYPKGYTAGLQCLTSMIVATIPPSLGLILFGFIGGVSIGRLFLAGVIPGIMMTIVYMIVVAITSKIRKFDPPDPDVGPPSFQEIFSSFRKSVWALLFPLILIIGIRFGVFTPTEAGAFAVVYALITGIIIYRELNLKGFAISLKDSFIDTGSILLIISMSGIFGFAMTFENVPGVLGGFLFGITTNPQLLMIIIVFFLVIIGLFIDANVLNLLFTPIVLPILIPMGVDPVHFGIIMMTMVTMGVFTPPVGTGIYIVCSIMDCPVEEYMKESVPFFVALIGLTIVFIFIPDIILWLPNLVFGP